MHVCWKSDEIQDSSDFQQTCACLLKIRWNQVIIRPSLINHEGKKLDPILICFEALREIKSLNFWWKSIKFVILQFSVLLNSLNLNEKFCSLFITPGPIHFCFSQNNIPEEPVAYSRCHIASTTTHLHTLFCTLP